MIKRFGLFIIVNFLILFMVNLIMNLLGLRPYLSGAGINYESLMVFCLLWGMGGSFISLMLSKRMAKWSMGLKVLDPQTEDPNARKLVATVYRQAQMAGLATMPEVAVYDSRDLNAFATGPSKNNSLVAVSTGLLNSMTSQEVDGVLAHEVSHIANGDMVTMTLIQGVLNAFVLFFAKALAWAAANALRGDKEQGDPSFLIVFAIEMSLQVVFGLLASMVVGWFSRQREFKADSGGARLAGSSAMISALRRLQTASEREDEDSDQADNQGSIAALKISTKPARFLQLMSTHPPLEDRIKALQANL